MRVSWVDACLGGGLWVAFSGGSLGWIEKDRKLSFHCLALPVAFFLVLVCHCLEGGSGYGWVRWDFSAIGG